MEKKDAVGNSKERDDVKKMSEMKDKMMFTSHPTKKKWSKGRSAMSVSQLETKVRWHEKLKRKTSSVQLGAKEFTSGPDRPFTSSTFHHAGKARLT